MYATVISVHAYITYATSNTYSLNLQPMRTFKNIINRKYKKNTLYTYWINLYIILTVFLWFHRYTCVFKYAWWRNFSQSMSLLNVQDGTEQLRKSSRNMSAHDSSSFRFIDKKTSNQFLEKPFIVMCCDVANIAMEHIYLINECNKLPYKQSKIMFKTIWKWCTYIAVLTKHHHVYNMKMMVALYIKSSIIALISFRIFKKTNSLILISPNLKHRLVTYVSLQTSQAINSTNIYIWP